MHTFKWGTICLLGFLYYLQSEGIYSCCILDIIFSWFCIWIFWFIRVIWIILSRKNLVGVFQLCAVRVTICCCNCWAKKFCIICDYKLLFCISSHLFRNKCNLKSVFTVFCNWICLSCNISIITCYFHSINFVIKIFWCISKCEFF